MPARRKRPSRRKSEQDRTENSVQLERVRVAQGQWYFAFLQALRVRGTIYHACLDAGVGRSTVDDARKRLPWFNEAIAEAKEDHKDILEEEATHRALVGTFEPHIYKGQYAFQEVIDAETGQLKKVPVGVFKKSDRMLELRLKAERPDKYKERIQVSSDDEVAKEIKLLTEELRQLDSELENRAGTVAGASPRTAASESREGSEAPDTQDNQA